MRHGRRPEAQQPVRVAAVACSALAHAWRSRAERQRTGTATTRVRCSMRLSSAAARSMAATTVPVRGTVECVENRYTRLNGGFLCEPRARLSSLSRFCVRQSERKNGPVAHALTRRQKPTSASALVTSGALAALTLLYLTSCRVSPTPVPGLSRLLVHLQDGPAPATSEL